MKAVLGFIGGVILAVALYVLPDMFANLGESLSFWLKVIWATVLLIISVAAVRTKESGIATFSITACIALVALIVFGGTMRLEELGIL